MTSWNTHIKIFAQSNTGKITVRIIQILLIMLWAYTAAVKLGNMKHNLDSMHKQLFPAYIADILAYLIPISALIIVAFLLLNIRTGILLSITLLTAIILYITVVLSEIIAPETCSCAGIFPWMDYRGHLIFSVIIWIIAIFGALILYKNKRGDAENRQQSRQHTIITSRS